MKDELMTAGTIEDRIYLIRGRQVMLDKDLAELYGVETRRLNEQVKRNMERFPEEFMFQLTREDIMELEREQNLMSQFATSSFGLPSANRVLISHFVLAGWGGNRKLPYVFTEQGVAMLAGVLRSATAVAVSIQIMNAFVQMRHFLQNNAEIFAELKSLKRQITDSEAHQEAADRRIDELFERMDKYAIDDRQGIFFHGQIFDAYAKFESFIAAAEREIILIDGYVDLSVLERLARKRAGVSARIITSRGARLTEQDIQKFNGQYQSLTVEYTERMHDRFLIIDQKTLYHVGASLKDLGKKCFAFGSLDAAFIPMILQSV